MLGKTANLMRLECVPAFRTSGAGEQLIAGVSIVVSREEMLLLLSCAVRGGAALPVPSTPALAPSGGGGGGGGGDDDGGDGGGGGSAVPATPSGPPGTPLAPLAPPPPPPSKEAAAQQEAWDAWLSAVQDGAKQLPAGTCQALNAAGWQVRQLLAGGGRVADCWLGLSSQRWASLDVVHLRGHSELRAGCCLHSSN